MWLAPGPEQAANGWESKRYWKVEPDSLDVNVKVGVWSEVEPDGDRRLGRRGGDSVDGEA